MRTRFWAAKTASTKTKRAARKPKEIDVSKLTPSQKQALAAALMGDLK